MSKQISSCHVLDHIQVKASVRIEPADVCSFNIDHMYWITKKRGGRIYSITEL